MSTPTPATMITQSGLARRLQVAPATLRRRLAAGVIQPDAILIEGSGLQPSALFNLSRMGEIRAAILPRRQSDTLA